MHFRKNRLQLVSKYRLSSVFALFITLSMTPFCSIKKNKRQSLGSASSDPEHHIIGGKDAGSGDYPFIISMADNLGHFCGGSLIARDLVLTAAHCLGGPYDVILGAYNRGKGDQEIPMKREIEHPQYNKKAESDNDFAVLVLDEMATLNSKVKTIKLGKNSPSVGDDVWVSGWGDTIQADNQSKLANKLQDVTVQVVSNRDC